MHFSTESYIYRKLRIETRPLKIVDKNISGELTYFQLPSVRSLKLQSVQSQKVRPKWKCLNLIFIHLRDSYPDF